MKIRNSVLIGITVVSLLFAVPVIADTTKDFACNAGGASEQYGCFRDILKEEEKEMNALLEQAIKGYSNMWGQEGTDENKKRMIEAQDAWKIYRDKNCHFDYYTNAPTHPASQSLNITICQLEKTRARIKEIEGQYLHRSE